MTISKRDCDKAAQENWDLAHQADRQGNSQIADSARERAIEWEKSRDSWFYRVFGL